MAAAEVVIELPTSRVSKYFQSPLPDVHDPNYIPVLNGAEVKVDFSQPSFSALPSIPTPHKYASQTYLKRSNSGSAPEMVVHSRDNPVSSHRTTVSKTVSGPETGSSFAPQREHGSSASSSDVFTVSSSEASTASAITALEEQVFMIPGNTAPRAEEIQKPAIPHSARSSISSTRKSQVPTSRFNKTPNIPTLPSSALYQQLKTTSQVYSRGASTEVSTFQQQQSPLSAPPIPPMEVPPATPPVQSTPRVHAAKSTASERRSRALHSHPSDICMKSRSNSVVEEADKKPLIQSTPAVTESRPSSSRSRSLSACNSQQPTPALDAQLPDLPVDALKKPHTKEKLTDQPLPSNTPNSPSRVVSPSVSAPQKNHVEMAEFMMSKKSVVFRRFDEVHVRLLLHLQDEITALEQELLDIDKAGPGRPEKTSNKANLMGELRTALAEYDHLFANWSSMQANKASDETKEQLAKWLKNPPAGPEDIAKGATEDLVWLQNSKDLSSVSIDPEKQPQESQTNGSGTGASPAGGGGGLLALFGCASKRK